MPILLLKDRPLTYPQIIAAGYLALIFLGTLLLSFPSASSNGITPNFTTVLFTATSASCVTGLVVADTFSQWSLFGQLVILLLIQVGGLGFMTFITLFSMALRRRIGLKTRSLLRESVNSLYIGGIVRLVRGIIIGTLFFELLGTVILSFRFIPDMGTAQGIYFAFFHSVSAFCNAGFDLMGFYQPNSSLTYYALDPLVNITICTLIIIGGIGFFVWDDLWRNRHHYKLYQLHTKVVLSSTGLLLVFGTIGIYLLERHRLLAGHTFAQQTMEAFFCSVTPRTAGFNTIDTGALSSAAIVLVLFLMFIGGSPGSVAGGIKTTTLVVLLLSAISGLENKKEEAIFGRLLEADSLRRATTVILLNSIMIWIATLLLAANNAGLELTSLLFEAVSAISTVGLSTGITAELTDSSRYVLIALMYFGRVGSLSFAHVFAEQRINSLIKYPIGKITIG